jgi:hypothetical protein
VSTVKLPTHKSVLISEAQALALSGLVIAVFGGWMLSFYGPTFASVHEPLIVMLVAQAVVALACLSLPVLIYRGRGRVALLWLVIWAVLGIGGMLLGGHLAVREGIAPEFGVACGQAIGLIGGHLMVRYAARFGTS